MNKNKEIIKDKELPVMMYVHGFMSGTNGAKQRQLQKKFKGRYRVIAPELDADPDKSLEILNRIIKEEKPEIIIGTSLGGWMALMCESGDAELVIVNPATDPYKTLSRWLEEPQTYFCQRLDGNQTYILTQEVLDKYLKYDTIEEIKEKKQRLHALCSTQDELIGDLHIATLKPLLPEERLKIVNDFGHQCRDAGLDHLFEIIEELLLKPLSEVEIQEHLKRTRKIDIESLLKEGYRKLEDVCRDIEENNCKTNE